MNIVPSKAGNNKLITHRTKVADKIPTVLTDTKPNNTRAMDPLTPISVIAIVGMTEIIKSIVVIKVIASTYKTWTSKTCKRIKNWVVKTIYLAIEYSKASNKSE